jgi:uncharacterized protein YbjT (DUF2867 family)
VDLKMSIVVTTPTGNIGKIVVQSLLKAGESVTVLVRNPDKLADAVRESVTVAQGNLNDKAFVAKATAGAEALFWLTPNDMTVADVRGYYETLAENAAYAVETNHIPYVVNLSSAGAQHETGLGPVSFIGVVERALRTVAPTVVQLRPGYFFENFLAQIGAIQNANALFIPFPPDLAYPMVATQDIGEVAAKHLLKRDATGEVIVGVHGPADLTMPEAAKIIGDAVNRPVNFVPLSSDEARKAFLSFGASAEFANIYVEMFEGFAKGLAPAEPRTPETTTPTTLAAWATDVLRPAVDAAPGR